MILDQFPALRRLLALSILPLALLGCSDSSDNFDPVDPVDPVDPIDPVDPVEPVPTLSARVAAEADLLTGPLARGVPGDFVLENEHLRVIIQQPGRQWLSIGTFGGNIIDVSAIDAEGNTLPDHMEEFVLGLNIENTPNYTAVTIVNDGSNGEPAQICASGPDDLLELANASSAIAEFGASLPASADDRDLPVEIETCYSLAAGERYITIDTTLTNLDSEDLDVFMTEYLNGSGQVEFFQPYAGFGEPTYTPSCPSSTSVTCAESDDGLCDQCNFVAYSGIDGADGVSYGLIYDQPGTSSFSTSGINIVVYGEGALRLILGFVGPNYTIPGDGELEFQRYFAVGDGTVASIADIRDELFGFETSQVSGVVASDGEPLADAQVVVYRVLDASANPPELFLVNHSRTGDEGEFLFNLPAGDYEIRANKEGYLYPEDDPGELVVESGVDQTRAIELPVPGYLELTVIDEVGPGPAKVQLVGFDPSPPLVNTVAAGQTAGVFGDAAADGLPYGIAQAVFIDTQGASERITIEPGDYQVVVSRGPRYSAYKQNITVVSGQVTTVAAEIIKLIDDSGFVHGDFHVHSIDSPDAEVTREERVAVMLAEGMDFFTPSDHGVRSDFLPTLQSMGVESLIGVAPSSETTTFDYGHFNSWPVTIDSNSISGGAYDWARAAPDGMDFPSYGNYNESPQEIIDGLKQDPMDNLVQINHVASFFGAVGLAVDTGMTPPASSTDLLSRRLDPSIGNGFDDGFDALEVWIGSSGRGGILSAFLGQNAGDWFNLINQNMVRIGIANSDTHSRRFTATSARTLIASTLDDPSQYTAEPEALAASVLAGKAIGTNAPFLLLEAQGNYNGSDGVAGLRIEQDTTLPLSAGEELTLTVTISTPQWAPVDTVDFYINNQPTRTTDLDKPARYGVTPDASVSAGDTGWSATEVVVNASVEGATRTDITVTYTLDSVIQDTWIVAMVRGSDGVSEPLFPVLPASLKQDSNLTLDDLTDGNLGELGVPAFAFTNPLFIDVGDNGWTAPGIAAVK